jgi:hypothetical protein
MAEGRALTQNYRFSAASKAAQIFGHLWHGSPNLKMPL